MRLAGTIRQYSKKAMPQEMRIVIQSGLSWRYFKCPYQAKVMKIFERLRRTMVVMTGLPPDPRQLSTPNFRRSRRGSDAPNERASRRQRQVRLFWRRHARRTGRRNTTMLYGKLDDFEAMGLRSLGGAISRSIDWIRELPANPKE